MREELRKYVSNNGTRQSWLAKQLGISRQMVSMYLSGHRDLGEENQEKLREFLDSRK